MSSQLRARRCTRSTSHHFDLYGEEEADKQLEAMEYVNDLIARNPDIIDEDLLSTDEEDEDNLELMHDLLHLSESNRKVSNNTNTMGDGFFISLLLTVLSLATFPFLLGLGLIQWILLGYPRASSANWPWKCRSCLAFVFQAILNALFLALLVYLLACSWFQLSPLDPALLVVSTSRSTSTEILLILEPWMVLQQELIQCREFFFLTLDGFADESVGGACRSGLLKLGQWIVLVVLISGFHTRQMKQRFAFLLVAGATVMLWNTYQTYLDSRLIISSIDPSYAMHNERINIQINGQNLRHGNQIGWVPYWHCLAEHAVDECEPQAIANILDGSTFTSFDNVDEYIPCYREERAEWKCFPDIQLRVKDKRSIPGWSLVDQKDTVALA